MCDCVSVCTCVHELRTECVHVHVCVGGLVSVCVCVRADIHTQTR